MRRTLWWAVLGTLSVVLVWALLRPTAGPELGVQEMAELCLLPPLHTHPEEPSPWDVVCQEPGPVPVKVWRLLAQQRELRDAFQGLQWAAVTLRHAGESAWQYRPVQAGHVLTWEAVRVTLPPGHVVLSDGAMGIHLACGLHCRATNGTSVLVGLCR